MATSTLIQYLETEQFSAFPGGGAVPVGEDVSHRSQKETFISGGAIAAGDWVAYDLAAAGSDKVLTVIQAANVAAGNTLVAGVAVQSAVGAGERVEVVTSGFVAGASVTTGVAAGARLVVDTTAGRGDAAAAGEIPCGVALTLAAANKADVLVLKYGL